MLHNSLQLIAPELKMVQEKMEKHFIIKAGHLAKFSGPGLGHANSYLRPALTLLCAGLFGKISDRAISLASIFQFIYIASNVHNDIKEDVEITNQEDWPGNNCHLPVLVGDYLYGRFFTTLCEAGIEKYLSPLAEIICTINEGGIMRLKAKEIENCPQEVDIIEKEVATLVAGCCSLGGHVAGAGQEHLDLLRGMGMNLGMAIGFMEKEQHLDVAGKYLAKSLSYLEQLPGGINRNVLRALLETMLSREAAAAKMVG